ncbi:MAG TPA: putative quinol monooxygenase [Devosia sp.]
MKLITGWLTCRPGTRDEFLARMKAPSEETRREPGCVFFEYHPHADKPDVVVLIEGFYDAAAHEAHRHTPHMAVMQAEVRRLLVKLRLCYAVTEESTWEEYDFVANPPGPWKP